MRIQYLGIKEINGPLIVIDGVKDAHFDEMADIVLENGEVRHGRIIRIDGQRAVIQVFEGTNDMSLSGSRTSFTGKPMQIGLSEEILGRVFDGAGRPIDGLGPVYAEKKADINGAAINPVARKYPNDFICTGISSIDMLMTLIRGQKLPIFSGSWAGRGICWPAKGSERIIRAPASGAESAFGCRSGAGSVSGSLPAAPKPIPERTREEA